MKKISIFVFVVLLTQLSFSQTLNVYTKSATLPQSFQLSQIDSITFQTTPIIPPSTGSWLTYDDSSYESTLAAQASYYYILVRFDRPSGWTNFNVTKIRMNLSTDASNDSIRLLCYNTQLSSGYYYPYQNLFSSTNRYDPQTGWNVYTVSWSLSIDKFCVGYLQIGLTSPSVKCDTSLPHNMRSSVVYLNGSSLTAALVTNANFAIQVYVEQSTGSPLIEPNGMWINGVISKNDLLEKGGLQDIPANFNYEAIPLGKLQNNLR